MWYGSAAVRHQHMPGQCTLFGKDEVVVVRDAPDEKRVAPWAVISVMLRQTIFSLC